VGYNTNGGNPYWRVRNSWGTGWGDNGFINMSMNNSDKGMCGINTQVYYAKF
jgi:C1A family cysteine protease